MLRFNEDGTITNLMTPEEENALMERIIRRNAYEDGAKNTTRNTAISMIKEKIPLEIISKVTKLSIKDLKKLKNNKKNKGYEKDVKI